LLEQADQGTLLDALVAHLYEIDDRARLRFLERLTGDTALAAELALPDDDWFIDDVQAFADECYAGEFLRGGGHYEYGEWVDEKEPDWGSEMDKYFALAADYLRAGRYRAAAEGYRILLSVMATAEFETTLFQARFPSSLLETDLEEATRNYFEALYHALPPKEFLTRGRADACRFSNYGGYEAFRHWAQQFDSR